MRGIANNITVTPPNVSSLEVRRAIEEALERRAEREGRKIQVDVSADGTVTLRGTVQSPEEMEAVVSAARYTAGVRSITNQLLYAA